MQGEAFKIQNEQEQRIAVTHFMSTAEWCLWRGQGIFQSQQ